MTPNATDPIQPARRSVSNAKLPADEVVVRLHQENWSNQQIAEKYGVTPEAVRIRLKRAGVTVERQRSDHSRYIPWRLRSDHTHDVIARRLRAYSKSKQGFALPPEEERKLQNWLSFMDGANPHGLLLSVHYDRNDPDGFWLEPRQPQDRDYIHPPA